MTWLRKVNKKLIFSSTTVAAPPYPTYTKMSLQRNTARCLDSTEARSVSIGETERQLDNLAGNEHGQYSTTLERIFGFTCPQRFDTGR